MEKEYCPYCHNYIETRTADCSNKQNPIPMVYPNNFQPKKETVEDKLDEIIRLLREIEYFLRIK